MSARKSPGNFADKPRLTVRPSRHGFVAQASRGGERWFVIAQEAPTRAEAEALVLQLAAEAMGRTAVGRAQDVARA